LEDLRLKIMAEGQEAFEPKRAKVEAYDKAAQKWVLDANKKAIGD
jgi:hypothetical protein